MSAPALSHPGGASPACAPQSDPPKGRARQFPWGPPELHHAAGGSPPGTHTRPVRSPPARWRETPPKTWPSAICLRTELTRTEPGRKTHFARRAEWHSYIGTPRPPLARGAAVGTRGGIAAARDAFPSDGTRFYPEPKPKPRATGTVPVISEFNHRARRLAVRDPINP